MLWFRGIGVQSLKLEVLILQATGDHFDGSGRERKREVVLVAAPASPTEAPLVALATTMGPFDIMAVSKHWLSVSEASSVG